VGAGTGKLTEVLVGLGHRVHACEPIAEMAALLAANIPEAAVARGRAEDLPYRDQSFDAVTVAQAFHWFDPIPSLEEMARVIAGGGVLSLVWNLRDTSAGLGARMSDIIGAERIDADEPWREAVAASRHFGVLEEAEFSYEQTLTLAELLALVRSRSVWATATPELQYTMLNEITRLIEGVDGIDPAAITLLYKTMAFRTIRS
jgi:SAM-dependent methyltransferase